MDHLKVPELVDQKVQIEKSKVAINKGLRLQLSFLQLSHLVIRFLFEVPRDYFGLRLFRNLQLNAHFGSPFPGTVEAAHSDL